MDEQRKPIPCAKHEWVIAPCSMAMAFVIGLPYWCKHCHEIWKPVSASPETVSRD
jgi:hypothetical protein